MNSFSFRKFTAVSSCKLSLKVLLLRLLLGSLLFAVGCDAWLFLLLAISPQTSQLSVNSCAIDQSVTPFRGWRRVCLLQKSQQSVFSRLVSIPYCNNNVMVCNRAGWDKTRRILREKADCKQSISWMTTMIIQTELDETRFCYQNTRYSNSFLACSVDCVCSCVQSVSLV